MKAGERVLGWDLLRGLSAAAVATYHLLSWQQVATVHAWGSYGVYLFFVLSGASLAYTYAPRLQAGSFRYGEFLWVRWMRLAPLYLLLMAVWIPLMPWLAQRLQGGSGLATQVLLNASFLFGFSDPTLRSVLVGGWSLGIEAVYYLLFPLLLAAAVRPAWGLAVFAVLAAVQVGWIAATAGSAAGYEAQAVRYHHPPAFAAYFMGGCLLGAWRRGTALRWPKRWGIAAFGAAFLLMALADPPHQGGELVGWRGLLLASLCFAVVAVAAQLRWDGLPARLAAWFGDATYGLYLLHPVLYFVLVLRLFPALGIAEPATWGVPARCVFAVALLAAAFGLALASERWFERPLRDWSRRRAGRPATATP